MYNDTNAISNKNAFQWDAYRPLQLPSGGGVCLGGVQPPVNRMTRQVEKLAPDFVCGR